jgi:coiled-coil domain-containing protein 22
MHNSLRDEVDGIILHQLRQIGAEIPDEVTSIKVLETEGLVDGCARCINAIVGGDSALPTKLPKGMSQRFRVGTDLANAVKDIGYMSEIGYNTFLYSNEAEARQLLMWLVERLPKEASEASAEVMNAAALFERSLTKQVAERLGSSWSPRYCTFLLSSLSLLFF